MQLKTARRFLARNSHKLTVHRINETGRAMLKMARIARKIIEKDDEERYKMKNAKYALL